jgi:hypothetical protein
VNEHVVRNVRSMFFARYKVKLTLSNRKILEAWNEYCDDDMLLEFLHTEQVQP